MVSTTSFTRVDWICTSCYVGNKLLPRKRNKPQWTNGRKLVILSDQNFPAALQSMGEKCPAVIHMEGGLLSELGDFFYSLLLDFTLPERSVLLIGSLSHLMTEGLVGYAKGTPRKRQVSKRQVSKRPVSKRLIRQVYKTSALQNVRFTKCQVYKTSVLQNVRLQKNIHIHSALVVGGNPQVLLQPCLQAQGWPCFILYYRGFFL